METSKSKLNPGFFFLCLGVLVTLIASVTSFLNLVFETLNKKFPDVLNASYEYGYNTYQYENIRSALATLIIIFPIFILISHFWKKYSFGKMGSVDEVIRKWMIYLILFLSSIVVAVDLVVLVRYFVSGEITTRFLLKVLATLVTAGIVGIYYIFELNVKGLKSRAGTVFAIVGSILVVGGMIASFMVMGSPMQQRQLRLDDRRVQDLQSLQWQIISYWQQKEKIPTSLTDLKDPISSYMVPIDPEMEKGMVYEYRAIDADTFELCATFARPMPKGWQENSYYGGGVRPMMAEGDMAVSSSSMPYPSGGNDSWDHQAGRTCFERTIDPDVYPPFEKPVKY